MKISYQIRRLAVLARLGLPWNELPESLLTPTLAHWLTAARASQQPAPILERLADYVEQSDRLRRRLRLAMAYPRLLLLLLVILLAGTAVLVAPTLVDMARTADRSWNGAKTAGLALTAVLLGGLALAARRKMQDTPENRQRLGQRMRDQSEQILWCVSLSHLLESGQDLPWSLEAAARGLQNPQSRAQALALVGQVQAGSDLAEALATTGWDPLITWAARAGQEHGQLPRALAEAGETLESELQNGLRRALAWLQPLALLISGALVLATLLLFWMFYWYYSVRLASPA